MSGVEGAFIRLHEAGSHVTAHHLFGRMASSVLPYLLALHFRRDTIIVRLRSDEYVMNL